MNGLAIYLDAANPNNFNLTEVEVLVVAGGGGGGSFNGGGGGAGGLIYNRNFAVTPGSALTVTVGAGGIGDGRPGNGATGASGAVGTNGGNSVFGSLTAIGGGVGASYSVRTSGGSGGSGGGSWGSLNFASGTAGQGNAGGGGYPIGNYYTETAGGGGGAGSNGIDGGTSSNQPGAGGLGLLLNISGNAQFYAAGGAAGANRLGGSALGGSGIGGNGGTTSSLAGVAGVSNTGSGGGGAAYNGFPGSSADGGAGGSGIVVVRYQGPQKAIGGTVTSVGGYTIHTFATVGSATFTPLVATNNSAISGLSDLSGRGNFGTSVNGPTYSSSNSGSIVFDGTNDNIQLGNTSNIVSASQSQITVNAWVKTNVVGVYKKILVNVTAGTASITGIYFSIGPSPYNTYFGVTTSGGQNSATYTQDISTTSYTNLCGTYDGSNIRLYLNGTLVATQALTGTLGTGGITRISGYDNNNETWNGNIAQVSVYNKALTATEVAQNFNALRGRFSI